VFGLLFTVCWLNRMWTFDASLLVYLDSSNVVWVTSVFSMPRVGSGAVIIGPLRFLTGGSKSHTNQSINQNLFSKQ